MAELVINVLIHLSGQVDNVEWILISVYLTSMVDAKPVMSLQHWIKTDVYQIIAIFMIMFKVYAPTALININ